MIGCFCFTRLLFGWYQYTRSTWFLNTCYLTGDAQFRAQVPVSCLWQDEQHKQQPQGPHGYPQQRKTLQVPPMWHDLQKEGTCCGLLQCCSISSAIFLLPLALWFVLEQGFPYLIFSSCLLNSQHIVTPLLYSHFSVLSTPFPQGCLKSHFIRRHPTKVEDTSSPQAPEPDTRMEIVSQHGLATTA